MLLEKPISTSLSLMSLNTCRSTREVINKVPSLGIVCVPKPQQSKLKNSNTREDITRQPLLLKSMREIEEKKSYLINLVIKRRNLLASRISSFLFQFHSILSFKRKLVIQKIIILRIYSVTLIQNRIRTFITHRHFKKMLHSTDALFFYNFKYSPSTSIAVHVKKEIKPLYYSKYLQCYYLQIKKTKIFKKRIKVHFIINGAKIIDSRYNVMNDSKGNYYNVILTSMLYKKVKYRSPKFNKRTTETKFFEKLFERKRKKSIDCSSVSDRSDISTELNHNMLWSYSFRKKTDLKCVKPILKNKSEQFAHRNKGMDSKKKLVSFNNTIELSY